MQAGSNSVLQFKLPFKGVQDRVRDAAEAGKVSMLARARRTMERDELSDILVIRALKRCQLLGKVYHGDAKGEWRCNFGFNVKGFGPGGSVAVLLTDGRVFVEDIHWDYSHEE
jgi:hypothetical protein